MKLIHYYPSIYSLFKQKMESACAESSFVLESKELEDFEKHKKDKFEINPLLKYKSISKDIEKNLGNNILIADPSVFFNKKNIRDFYKYVLNFKDQDICIARNLKRNSLNASVLKIKCTKKTLALFNHITQRIKNNKSENPEEGVINNVLKEWKERITLSEFNTKVACTPFISSEAIRENYFAWVVQIKNEGSTQSKLYDSKVKIVYDHRFITKEDYAYYKL